VKPLLDKDINKIIFADSFYCRWVLNNIARLGRPVQMTPLPQLHWSDMRNCAGLACSPRSAAQFRFDALIEPSLHRNSAPSHRSIPPFFPEHG
jgi:hypothetical protein